ncbi:MAG TPA: Gfo/Idh/MocA family oxidoreductase [Terriglobales bacterium]|nr:Gfo/Idh/MocA family oxidoreductase [Terriglobales bacterium]
MTDNTRRDFLKKTAAVSAAFLVPKFASGALGANDRVRIAMIGVGSRGQELLKQIVAVPRTEVVAIADVYTRRLEEAKQIAPGIQTFDDHRRVLDMKDIDGVIVATPLHIHARHFLDTLAAGKDLYAEKTMTWSIPEAEKCLEAARKSDRVIQIGLQHESGGPFIDAKKWISAGMLGKVNQVESWMSRNTAHGQGQWVRQPAGDCTAQNVKWDAFLNGRPDKGFDAYKFMNWRLFWMFSGGNITENMIHQIAWIMSALDLPLPSAAYMSGGIFSEKDGREVPDTIAVTLDFPDEVVVTWQSTFSNRRYGLGQRILGSDGTVEYIAGATDMVRGESEEQVHYYPEKINRPNGSEIAGNSPTINHMANWVECMRSRKTPNAPVQLGYGSAVAAHMANLSYRQQRRITLEEAKAFQPEY